MKVSPHQLKRILLVAAKTTGATALMLIFLKYFEKWVGPPIRDRSFDESYFQFHALTTLPLVFVIISVQIYWQEKRKNSDRANSG